MGTNIMGDLTIEQLKSEASIFSQNISRTWQEEVEDIEWNREGERRINPTQASFTIETEQPYLSPFTPIDPQEKLSQSFRISRRRTDKKWKFGRREYDIAFCLATIFPYHQLAWINFDEKSFEEDSPHTLKFLRERGYTIHQGRRVNGGLTKKREEEFLALLRSPENSLQAIDPRAIAILSALHKNLTPTPQFYKFGIFTPRCHIRKKPRDVYDGGRTEITLRRVHGISTFPAIEPDLFKGLELIAKGKPPLIALKRTYSSQSKGLPLTRAIGITSRVDVDGSPPMHIPMIDFDYDGRGVEETLEKLRMPGLLVASGNSYHFYGYTLLTQQEWQEWSDTLAEEKSIGSAWPRLQREQGFGMLRITSCKYKPTQPCIVKEFKPRYLEGGFLESRRRQPEKSMRTQAIAS